MGRISKAKTMLWMPLAVGLAVACGDQPVENAGAELAAIARMDVIAGDAQTGEIGSQLPSPLVVRVSDALGRPIQHQIVNFRVTEGGGSVFAGAAITDAQGRAQEWWTLGGAEGLNKIEARAVDSASGEKVVFARFSAKGLKKGAQPPGSEKPAEEKPADEKPAEEKPADDKPAEEKPAEEKPADEKPAEEKPADDKPAEEKPAEEKPAEEKRAEEKPAEEKPADKKPVEETSSSAWTRGVWEITGGGVSVELDLDRRVVTLPQIGAISITRTVSGNRLNISFQLPRQGTASMALQHQSGQLRGTARLGGQSEAVVGRRQSAADPAPTRPQPQQPAPQQPAPQQPAPTPPPPSGSAGAVFQENFESYGNGASVRGEGNSAFQWTNARYSRVSTARAHSGRSSLEFRFGPIEPDGSSHMWAEQRFSHTPVQEYWMEYYVFIPENYRHVGDGGSTNNKLYSWWGPNGYSAPGMGMFQLWASGGNSTVDVSRYGPNSRYAEYPGRQSPLFDASHRGTWQRIRIHIKLADLNRSNGIQRLWRGNQLIVNQTGDANSSNSASANVLNAGYLWGYDNSGFAANTTFYVDDVQFFTRNPGW